MIIVIFMKYIQHPLTTKHTLHGCSLFFQLDMLILHKEIVTFDTKYLSSAVLDSCLIKCDK